MPPMPSQQLGIQIWGRIATALANILPLPRGALTLLQANETNEDQHAKPCLMLVKAWPEKHALSLSIHFLEESLLWKRSLPQRVLCIINVAILLVTSSLIPSIDARRGELQSQMGKAADTIVPQGLL